MYELLKSLSDKLDNQYLIFIIIITIILIVSFKKEYKQGLRGYLYKVKKALWYSPKIKELEDHDVFSTFNRVTGEVYSTRFYTANEYDVTKSRMCYDFTVQKARSCKELMIELVNIEGVDTMQKDKLKKLILSKQTQMHKNYVKDIKAFWLSKGINKKDVEHVIRLFEQFRFPVINSFEHRINAIFSSGFHPNNFEMLLAVFDMWSMGIDLLPKDMITTFETLNGKFKDIEYK